MSSLKVAYVWRHAQSVDYLLSTHDARFETLAYMARYHQVLCVAPSAEGWTYQVQRGGCPPMAPYAVVGVPDFAHLLDVVAQFQPDAIVCEGSPQEEEWELVFARFPSTWTCLLYGGGPLWDANNDVLPMALRWSCIMVGHETQRRWLKDHGVPRVVRGLGAPPQWFRPMNLPKQFHVFCPANFAPGKRVPIVAQYLEQFAPQHLPSLLAGNADHPNQLDMARWGGIPLNLPTARPRNGAIITGRLPPGIMPWAYNMAEVVVTMSQEEANPYCVIEALSCGTPVIVASDCEWLVSEAWSELAAATKHANSNGQAPLQVVPPLPEAIRAAIERLNLCDPITTRQTAAAARALLLPEYDWWRMYSAIDRMLRQGLALQQSGQLDQFPDEVGSGD